MTSPDQETMIKLSQDLKNHAYPGEMYPTVYGYRDGDLVAGATVAGTREHLFFAIRTLVGGFGATGVLFVGDSYGTTLKENPITELPWAPGELEILADQYNGREMGWVHDAISAVYADEGTTVFTQTPYVERDELEWIEPESVEKTEVGGAITTVIREIIKQQDVGLMPDFMKQGFTKTIMDEAGVEATDMRDVLDIMLVTTIAHFGKREPKYMGTSFFIVAEDETRREKIHSIRSQIKSEAPVRMGYHA